MKRVVLLSLLCFVLIGIKAQKNVDLGDRCTYGNLPKNAAQLYEAATREFDANHFESSLKLYLKADSAYKAEGQTNTPEYAQALHSTGRAYFNTNNIQAGREFTHRALELREKLFGKVSEKYIVSLNNYALSFLMANELEGALKYQIEVIELCRKMNSPHPDEGMYLINLARIYHAMQDDESAVKYMEEALPKVEKFSTNYEYALNFLGMVYMEKNDNANTNRIMGLMEEHNKHELTKECNTPECHLERAEYYMTKGKPANAKDEFMAVFAMPLSDEQKADAYQQYAKFLSSQRDYAQAGEYYAMAANVSMPANEKSENATALLHRAGLCYFVGKEYDKAIDAHTKVITNVDKYGYAESLKSSSLQGLGNAYSAKKDYPKSITAYKQWIEHLKANGRENEADYAKAYERLAAAEKFNSDYDASISDYETAIALYEKLGMNDEAEQARDGLKMCLFYARKDMGDLADNNVAMQQRTNKLREIIQSSINSLEQGGDYLGNLSKAQTLATLAGSYAQLEDYNNAIDYYTQYINIIRPALIEDFLLKNPKERELTWKQELSNITRMNALITELPKETSELYSRLSNLIYEGQLLAKGILLSSNIEFDKVLSRYGTTEMKNQYMQIKSNLIDIDKMKEEHLPVEEIQSKIRETDALQLSLARESVTKGIFTDFLKYTSSDVVSALNADEAAIEFVTLETGILPGEDMIAAVVVSKEFPTGITIPICTVKDINFIIEDKEKFAKNDYTERVWGGIMQIVQDKKKIYFAPDGVLNNIGIEYLTMNSTPINEMIEVSRLSSTREICREHLSQPLQYAALFGNIDYDDLGKPTETSDKREYRKKRGAVGGIFNSLENTGREVSEIGSILKNNVPQTTILPYTGKKASKAEFLSQEKFPINLLHIATHGKYIAGDKVSDNDAMNRSILAFAGANLYDNIAENEGMVTAAEIADMSLQNCELVVLSACESGLGKLGNDGVFGLQRGFKNAGVKSLLVSLNEVADEATADMMIAFYRNLMTDSASKSEAFKKAQSEIRVKYPNDDTWASFILIDSFN